MKKIKCYFCKKKGIKADWIIGWNDNILICHCSLCDKKYIQETGTTTDVDGVTSGVSSYYEINSDQLNEINNREKKVSEIQDWLRKSNVKYLGKEHHNYDC